MEMVLLETLRIQERVSNPKEGLSNPKLVSVTLANNFGKSKEGPVSEGSVVIARKFVLAIYGMVSTLRRRFP